MAGGAAELVWLPGGSALLSPWPKYAPGALLAPAQSRELLPQRLGKGCWLVSPSSVPPSRGRGAGDTDTCVWLVMPKSMDFFPVDSHQLMSRHCFPGQE